MIKCSRRKLAQAFVHLLDQYPRKLAVTLLAREIIQQGRERELDILVLEIARQLHHRRHILIAQAYSVYSPPLYLMREIKNLLHTVTGAKYVELATISDPSLVGGIVVRTPELELDFSIRGVLHQLI